MERNAHQYSFEYMMIVHIAKKFGTLITGRGTIFTLKDESTISLEFDQVTGIKLQGTEIYFVSSEKLYKIEPDLIEPTLWIRVDIPGRDNPSWEKLELSH